MRKVQLVVGEKLIEEANRIQGLKRYLLNFNQVPRQTELTEQGYKYLLCCAELLGIGTDVAKETADMIIIDNDYNIDTVISKGKTIVKEKKLIKRSYYNE